MMIKIPLLIIVSVLLSSCAVMNQQDCLHANWSVLGKQDGYRGNGSLLQQRSAACAKHQIALNQQQYQQGYQTGLAYYCTPQTVFDYALEGKGNYSHCPIEQQNRLRPFYNTAHNYYQAQSQLKTLEQTRAESGSKAYDRSLKEKTRQYHRQRLSETNGKIDQARRDYYNAQRELEYFKRYANFAD